MSETVSPEPCFVCGDPTIRPAGHCSGCDPAELCEGHESLAGEHMGEAVFCDGTCSRDHPRNRRRAAPGCRA